MKRVKAFRILFLVLFLLSAVTLSADTLSDVDSLLNCYSRQRGIEQKSTAEALLKIFDRSAVFFDDTPRVDKDSHQEHNDLMVWFGTVRFYTTNSYYSEALDYIEKAMPLARKSNLNIYATLLCDKSYCLFKLSNYPEAIKAGMTAVDLCKQTNNLMQLSRAYLYLALVNHSLAEFDESKTLVLKAIEVNEQLGLNPQTHNALGIACEIFCSAREVDKAVEFGRRAVESARAIDYEPGVANHLMQLSYAYDCQGDYDRGLAAADSAIALVTAQEPVDRNQLALTLEYKSWNLIDMGRYKEAADALRETIRLNEEIGNKHAVWNCYRTLCAALQTIDVEAALVALKQYTFMGDSIHSAQLNEALANANAQFRNDELKMESEHSRRMSRTILISSLAVVLLLIMAIVSLLSAYRQRNRTAQNLQKLTKARETFFNNVTHEFRTPLTVIMGYGKLLKDKPSASEETIRSSGEAIEREGNQLLGLVGELLDLAKLQSVTIDDTAERWRTDNIVPYLRMMLEPFYDDAYQLGVDLVFKPFENTVAMDFVPGYVQKVVGNLVSHALQRTPSGGSVTVSTRRDGQNFVMQVADTGESLAPAQLETIFEPFSQSDGSQSASMGIALTLVQQIALAVGGTITAGNNEGRGTTITLSVPVESGKGKHRPLSPEEKVPLSAEATTTDVNAAEVAALVTDVPSDEGGVSILVVEDNRDVAYLIGSLLAGKGYSISYASNGRQGLEMAEQLIPDLIITDVMMSQMDGLELCRQIRANDLTNHIPIIVVTARISSDDLKRGIESGADAYLFKPFDADELQLRIVKLLEMRQLLRDKFSRIAAVTQDGMVQDADSKSLSLADQKFLGRLIDLVYSLMGQQQVDIETVASRLNITSSQLRRKMVALTGQTPAAYIMQIRLTNAQRLLDAHPEMSIADVAYRCGFSNQSHLSASFQKAFGMSPTQWAHRPKQQS